MTSTDSTARARLAFEDVSVAIGGRTLLAGLDFTLAPGITRPAAEALVSAGACASASLRLPNPNIFTSI